MATVKSPVLRSIEESASGSKWLELLSKTIDGTSGEEAFQKLGSLTLDDIRLDPIYPLKNADVPSGTSPFRAEATWKTIARIDLPDPTAANKQLLTDLEQGADGAVIVLKNAPSAFGFGVELSEGKMFDALLENVFVDATHLRFEGLHPEHLQAWNSFCKSRHYAPDTLSVSLGINNCPSPAGDFATSGFTADGAQWHNRGASAAQELGFTLSQLVDYLRLSLKAGVVGTEAAAAVDAKLSCDADQFETLSKCRTMRQLWARVLDVSNIDDTSLTIHAETSWRMMSRRDPWTNMLRATIASFSAGLGGVDSIAILPHTQALGLPDAFARRVARNTSLVLQEESHLNHVVDPAAGAGLFDSFSSKLAEKAWRIFQDIEAAGGWSDALSAKIPLDLTAKSRGQRLDLIERRKTVSLGNSHFPKLDEKPVQVLSKRPLEKSGSNEPLTYMRDGLPFEQLAERAAKLGADQSAKVVLVCIGPSKKYKPRESFASDFFAAAGMACVSFEALTDKDVSSIDTKSTPIICLCGSDDDYANSASAILSQLKSDDAQYLLVAGRGDIAAADTHIFIGSNAYQALEKTLTILEGVTR